MKTDWRNRKGVDGQKEAKERLRREGSMKVRRKMKNSLYLHQVCGSVVHSGSVHYREELLMEAVFQHHAAHWPSNPADRRQPGRCLAVDND